MSDNTIRTVRGGRFFKNYHIHKNLFSKEECEKAIEFFRSKAYLQATVMDNDNSKGNDIKTITMDDVRKGHIVFGHPTDKELEIFFKKLYSIAIFSNFGWSILPAKFLQITEYDSSTDGGFYKRHKDVIIDQTPQRILSVVVQLSPPEYSGCELVFDKDQGMPESNMFKNQGDAIFFLSDEPHEVTPITSGVRYSMVGWFPGPTCWTNETLPSHF